MEKTQNSNSERIGIDSAVMFYPFADWSKGAEYYFGYTVDADGNNVTDPDEDQPDLTEWHLEYMGGGIYELEYAPAENCMTTVYRGNIPTREFFVALMSNVESAPKIDWANAKVSESDPRNKTMKSQTNVNAGEDSPASPCSASSADKEKMRTLMKIQCAKLEGYAGVLPNGNVVDRREHPKAIPLQKNSLLFIPEPRHVCTTCGRPYASGRKQCRCYEPNAEISESEPAK